MKLASVFSKLLAGRLGPTLLLFAAVLAILFYGVFVPGQTKFSNDGPLGELMAQCHRLPDRFTGCWSDLDNVGFNAGAASPGISLGLQWLLGPVLFSKLYALVALLILGWGAWCFFRQLRLAPLACVLGGLAAMLNSTFFSVACWGVAAHDLVAGMTFFALAALVDLSGRQSWLRVILAGFAVGMGVVEGADVGAIFSLLVAAFILCQAWLAEGSRVQNTAWGLGRLLLVAGCAAFLAMQAIYGLVDTSIKGVVGMQQDVKAQQQHWDWATQWSLPKREVLTFLVPGLFGFRSDTPAGGIYWGAIGRDPAWDRYFAQGSQGPQPDGFLRYSGGGNYGGELVLLVAIWAGVQSFRRKDGAFAPVQRQWLWFWIGTAVLSLLLAFGRFAPVYQFFYALPYMSTIRNPAKFLYPFSFALVVLFAFGLDGLVRKYMPATGPRAAGRWAGLQYWWRTATKFEKYWMYGCGAVLAAGVLAWLVYANHRAELTAYLRSVHVDAPEDSVASFSIRQAGWFPLAFLLAAGLLALIFSGAFAGNRAAKGGLVLGVFLLADLGLANQPWIIYWNYQDKYASNPILDRLRDQPFEHRVAIVPMDFAPELSVFRELYRNEWMQQQFPYYNIQSFEVVEMSRLPSDLSAFVKMLEPAEETNTLRRLVRAWQLTNTRFFLAPVDFGTYWADQAFLAPTPLRVVTPFDIVPKPGISEVTKLSQLTAVPETGGRFALFDFPAALPRAKLYDHWQVATNSAAALDQIFSPAFDPQATVLVDDGWLPAPAKLRTNTPAAPVEFVHYAPKDIVLRADAAAPSVLLLNDHYDPNWRVFVDGQPERLLRCNFLMRGVQLPPGSHTVEFKFQPPVKFLYVSVVALAIALAALGILMISLHSTRPAVPSAAPLPVAAAPAPKTEPPKRRNSERRQKTKRQ